MKRKIVFILIIAIALSSSYIFAGINESMEKAFEYKKKYGAYNPFFRTDKRGEVVAECWNAPYDTWTVDQALKFSKEILKEKLKKEEPENTYTDAFKKVFHFKDGTKIVLKMMSGRCILIGVYQPSYNGPDC